jgi:hypothetical protein
MAIIEHVLATQDARKGNKKLAVMKSDNSCAKPAGGVT